MIYGLISSRLDSDEFRRRSGSSRSDGKRWGRKDTGGGELRCCIQPDLLRSNVDKHWFFEDEQVSARLSGQNLRFVLFFRKLMNFEVVGF